MELFIKDMIKCDNFYLRKCLEYKFTQSKNIIIKFVAHSIRIRQIDSNERITFWICTHDIDVDDHIEKFMIAKKRAIESIENILQNYKNLNVTFE